MSPDDDLNLAQRHRFGGAPLLQSKEGRRVVDALTGILAALFVVLAWKLLHREQPAFLELAPEHYADRSDPYP